MELPIAPQQYQPTADALVRASKRARAILARAVAEEVRFDRATLFVQPQRPNVRLANYATEIAPDAGQDADSVVAQVLDEVTQRGAPCQTLDAAEVAEPDVLHDVATSRGYLAKVKQVYRLAHFKAPARLNEKIQIIPARAAYAELRRFYRKALTHEYAGGDAKLADDLVDTFIDKLDEPRLELFLGRIEGQPVGVAGVVTLGQMGVIDPVLADPDCRGQGVGKTLLAHTIEHCIRSQFEQVLVERSQGCYATPLYEAAGFTLAASYVKYFKHLDH